ncbi:hypothetical protein NQ318_016068 [Aromia moschata]|uniref:Uncharacterized protein n=1 Tax=Aromia moschata TaxID=1265417 RepID=A0AAV8XQV9_9CUCU|nr:hypothetical protein NQ318_016068 [Aromia moschata]
MAEESSHLRNDQNVEYYLVTIFEKLEVIRREATTAVDRSKVSMQVEIRTLEFWKSVISECLASFILRLRRLRSGCWSWTRRTDLFGASGDRLGGRLRHDVFDAVLRTHFWCPCEPFRFDSHGGHKENISFANPPLHLSPMWGWHSGSGISLWTEYLLEVGVLMLEPMLPSVKAFEFEYHLPFSAVAISDRASLLTAHLVHKLFTFININKGWTERRI